VSSAVVITVWEKYWTISWYIYWWNPVPLSTEIVKSLRTFLWADWPLVIPRHPI